MNKTVKTNGISKQTRIAKTNPNKNCSSEIELARQKLAANEARYRGLFNHMTEGFALCEMVYDSQGNPKDYRFLDVNDAFEKVSGKKRENVVGKLRSQTMKRNNPESFKIYAQVARTGKPARFENHLLDIGKDSKVYVYSPAPNQFATLFTDITENNRYRKALEETKEKLNIIIDNTPDHILIQDLNLRYIFVTNPQLGLTRKGMIGKTDYELTDKITAGKLVGIKKKVLATGQAEYIENIPIPNIYGRTHYFNGSYVPRRDSKGRITGLIGYFRNVTKQVKIAEDLQKTKNLYQSLFSSMTEGLAFCEIICEKNDKPVDYRFLDVNGAFEKYTGLKRKNIIGKTHKEINRINIPDEIEIFGQVALNRKPVSFEKYYNSYRKYFRIYVYSPAPRQFAMLFMDITARKNAEQKLIASESRYRGLYEAIMGGVTVHDDNGYIIEANDIACEILGMTLQEMRARSPKDPRWKAINEDRTEMCSICHPSMIALATGQTVKNKIMGIYREDLKDYRWLLVNAQPVKRENGKEIAHIVTTFVDITEQKSAKEKVAYQAKLLSKVKDAVIACDAQKRITFWNTAAKNMYGWNSSEVIGKKLEEVISPATKKMERITSDNNTTRAEYLNCRRDGSEFWVGSTASTFYNNGKISGYITINRDITRRKTTEEKLKDFARQLEFAQKAAMSGTWTRDFNTGEVKWTRGIYELFDLDPDKNHLTFENFISFVHPSDRAILSARINEAVKNKTPINNEYRIILPNGKVRWINDIGNTTYDANGRPLQSAGISINITERKETEILLKNLTMRLELAQKAARCGFWSRNIQTRDTTWSREIFRILRMDPEKNKADFYKFIELIHPEDRECVVNQARNSVKNITPINVEFRIILQNGMTRWINAIGNTTTNEKKQPIEFAGVMLDITSKKETEKLVKNLTRNLELAQKAANIGSWNENLITNEFTASREFYRLLELDPEADKIGKKILFTMAHPEDQKCAIRAFNRTLGKNGIQNKKEPLNAEIRIITKSGKIRWINIIGNLVYSNKNIPTELAGVIIDITERKKSQEQLDKALRDLQKEKQQTEALLNRIAMEKNILDVTTENTDTQLAYLDRDFNFVKVNSAYCANSGHSAKELIGNNHFKFFPNKETQEIFEYARDTGNPVKFSARPFIYQEAPEKGTFYRDWTLMPVKDNHGNVTNLVFSIVDVTRRIKNENDLAKYANDMRRLNDDLKKMQLAVENASDIILIMNTKGSIMYANNALETLTGYRPCDVIGQRPSQVAVKMNRNFYSRAWEALKNNKTNFSSEVSIVKKNGEQAVFELHLSPILDDSDKLVFIVAIARDCTVAKEIDRAKTEFISLASHQLRTPLTMISLATEMLMRENKETLPDDIRVYLGQIFENTDRMTELIDLFLNVSRIELGRLQIDPRPSNIAQLCGNILDNIAPKISAQKLNLQTDISNKLPVINIDRNVLNIALGNLLSNASKYTPEGGTINFSVQEKDKNIIIKVSDTGRGIPKKQLPKLFTKLFRADNSADVKGLGLGLYIAKNVIEQSGGSITVKTQENKGSTFIISIPLEGMKKKGAPIN